jgi:hypothetical protein
MAGSRQNEAMPAGRWERLRAKKRPDRPAPASAPRSHGDEDGTVHLDDAAHDWWAKRDATTSYVHQEPTPKPGEPAPPRPKPKATSAVTDEPKRDTFSEYFSTESLFAHNQPGDTGPRAAPEDDLGPFSADDPYVVLGIPASASWEDITVAHRRLAKLHHPDRLLNATETDRHRSEQRMRDINIAYSELRRRRGK